MAALRLAYGKSYFKHWSDEESMIELQKLYSLRTAGTKFILRCWRVRLATIFCFQVVVMMWFRYTVDLWLDLQAMKIFLEQEPLDSQPEMGRCDRKLARNVLFTGVLSRDHAENGSNAFQWHSSEDV